MTMHTRKAFSGSFTAVITPFSDDQIDFLSWQKFVDWQIEQGTQGIVVCGTTGESATLTHDEQARAIEAMVEMVDHRVPVIAGAGSNATHEAVSLANRAANVGADGILSVTPYYNKPTQCGLVKHFRAVCEATDLPVILYNVPGRTGVSMSVDTVLRISGFGKVDSVKEASGDIHQCQELLNSGVRVFSGEDAINMPLLAMGASGIISVVANFAPQLMRRLCDSIANNKLHEAREINRSVYALAQAAFAVTNPIPAKAAVSMLGFCREEYRLPLSPLSEKQRNELLFVMKKYELVGD